MKWVHKIALLATGLVFFSCKQNETPTQPEKPPPVETWQGTGRYYFKDYSLVLTLDRSLPDSVSAQMIVIFDTYSDTLIMKSPFLTDSLSFTLLKQRGGFCRFLSVAARAITEDSLSGVWRYRCINNLPFADAWSAKKKDV